MYVGQQHAESAGLIPPQIVSLVQQSEWINTIGYSPLLRYSVLASLLSEYVPDGVGISPTTLHKSAPDTAKENGDDTKLSQSSE